MLAEGVISVPDAATIAGQLMENPGVLAALQGRLEGMIGARSGYIERYLSNHLAQVTSHV